MCVREEKMVRPGLEPGTFCVLDRCDNQLRHRTSQLTLRNINRSSRVADAQNYRARGRTRTWPTVETATSATDPQGQMVMGQKQAFFSLSGKTQLTPEHFVSDERSGTTVARFSPLTLTTMRAPRLPN